MEYKHNQVFTKTQQVFHDKNMYTMSKNLEECEQILQQ